MSGTKGESQRKGGGNKPRRPKGQLQPQRGDPWQKKFHCPPQRPADVGGRLDTLSMG